MKTFEHIQDWISARDNLPSGKTLGFVPTMGALHDGHLSLVDESHRQNDFTAVSIFVNPTQFNNSEDLAKYPRTLSRDLELLSSRGVDFVLLPNEDEIYGDQYRFQVSEQKESRILCGAFRPGHFEGVLTVVMKLLNLAGADRCYMGEKDYQQYRLIKDMARAFFLKTEIVGCPIVREKSGLAMSSRNERLSLKAREHAAQIFKILSAAETSEQARRDLEAADFQVEYVEEMWGRRLAAVWYEGVRLIDNVVNK